MTFEGNLYWSSGGAVDLEGSTSLDAWRKATGQETMEGASVGDFADPRLTPYVPACVSKGGKPAVGIPQFRISPPSPVVDKGLAPTRFTSDPGVRDFWGTALYQGAAYDIGAEEVPRSSP